MLLAAAFCGEPPAALEVAAAAAASALPPHAQRPPAAPLEGAGTALADVALLLAPPPTGGSIPDSWASLLLESLSKASSFG